MYLQSKILCDEYFNKGMNKVVSEPREESPAISWMWYKPKSQRIDSKFTFHIISNQPLTSNEPTDPSDLTSCLLPTSTSPTPSSLNYCHRLTTGIPTLHSGLHCSQNAFRRQRSDLTASFLNLPTTSHCSQSTIQTSSNPRGLPILHSSLSISHLNSRQTNSGLALRHLQALNETVLNRSNDLLLIPPRALQTPPHPMVSARVSRAPQTFPSHIHDPSVTFVLIFQDPSDGISHPNSGTQSSSLPPNSLTNMLNHIL